MRRRSAPGSPAEIYRLWLGTGLMLAEAQMVIGMRMLGMFGLWRVTPGENRRMVAEKLAAAAEAGLAASRAAATGRSPAQIGAQALKPVRRRTGANLRRLSRRGPGKG